MQEIKVAFVSNGSPQSTLTNNELVIPIYYIERRRQTHVIGFKHHLNSLFFLTYNDLSVGVITLQVIPIFTATEAQNHCHFRSLLYF